MDIDDIQNFNLALLTADVASLQKHVSNVQVWLDYQADNIAPETIVAIERKAVMEVWRSTKKSGVVAAYLAVGGLLVACGTCFLADQPLFQPANYGNLAVCGLAGIIGLVSAVVALHNLFLYRPQKTYCWLMAEKMLASRGAAPPR